MKFLKKLFSYIAVILIAGGILVLVWQYFRNKNLFAVLLSNSIVKGSLSVLKMMGMALIAVIVGLICFSISLKCGSIVRRNEREKKEALREQQRENEELNRKLKKEAEEARAEAEKARKENEMMRQTLMKEPETENSEEQT